MFWLFRTLHVRMILITMGVCCVSHVLCGAGVVFLGSFAYFQSGLLVGVCNLFGAFVVCGPCFVVQVCVFCEVWAAFRLGECLGSAFFQVCVVVLMGKASAVHLFLIGGGDG